MKLTFDKPVYPEKFTKRFLKKFPKAGELTGLDILSLVDLYRRALIDCGLFTKDAEKAHREFYYSVRFGDPFDSSTPDSISLEKLLKKHSRFKNET